MSLQVKNVALMIEDRLIFNQQSFSLLPGEILKVAGDNGAGKTSLLSIIAGLKVPSTGDISLNQISHLKKSEYQQNILYIGHQLGLYAELSVFENLRLIQEMYQAKANLKLLLEEHRLLKYQDYLVSELSQGLKKRVSLVQLTLIDRALYILDEPLAALDRQTQTFISQLVMQLNEKGKMVMISSHQPLGFTVDKTVSLSA